MPCKLRSKNLAQKMRHVNLIVAIDSKGGIAKNGNIPWQNSKDMLLFKTLTSAKNLIISPNQVSIKSNNPTAPTYISSLSNTLDFKYTDVELGNNLLICGRKTAQTLPSLPNRQVYILSRANNSYKNLFVELQELNYDNIWVIGGLEIYNLFLTRMAHLIDYIFVSRIAGNFQCDKFFNFSYNTDYLFYAHFVKEIKEYVDGKISPRHIKKTDFELFITDINADFAIKPSEHQYLKILKKLIYTQALRPNRTGVLTKSIFGHQMRFSIMHSVPLLTCKKTFWKSALRELLFFISGQTDTKILEKEGVNIWKKNTELTNGDMGPMYGFQWRHFDGDWNEKTEEKRFSDGKVAKLADPTESPKNLIEDISLRSSNSSEEIEDNISLNSSIKNSHKNGFDQLTDLIQNIKRNPYDRAHLLTAYNPKQKEQGVLKPCHVLAQFYVDEKNLSCHLYQRSADTFLGVPFNIISYSFLTYMIAYLCKLKPDQLIISYGDIHIYSNHIEQAKKLLSNQLYPFPALKLVNVEEVKTIDDFKFEHFQIEDYVSNEYIAGEIN